MVSEIIHIFQLESGFLVEGFNVYALTEGLSILNAVLRIYLLNLMFVFHCRSLAGSFERKF